MISRKVLLLVSLMVFMQSTHGQSLRVFYAPMRKLYLVVQSRSNRDVRKVDPRDLEIYVGPPARVFQQTILKGSGIQCSGVPLNSGFFFEYPFCRIDDDPADERWVLWYETPHPSAAHENLIELDSTKRATIESLNLIGPRDFVSGNEKPTVHDIETCEENLLGNRGFKRRL